MGKQLLNRPRQLH